jgi:hypothetical protein
MFAYVRRNTRLPPPPARTLVTAEPASSSERFEGVPTFSVVADSEAAAPIDALDRSGRSLDAPRGLSALPAGTWLGTRRSPLASASPWRIELTSGLPWMACDSFGMKIKTGRVLRAGGWTSRNCARVSLCG